MGSGVPSAESHPRHQDWVHAGIRYLKAKLRLEKLKQSDRAYLDTLSECMKAKEAYKTAVAQLF